MPIFQNESEGHETTMRQKFLNCFLVLATFAFVFTFLPRESRAEIIDVTGGVKDDYTYEEYIFISGKPVKFTATAKDVKVTRNESKNSITESYNMTLTGPEKNDKLTRNITYQFDVEDYDSIGQSTANGRMTKYSESITLDGVKYQLVTDGYQITRGRVTDNLPASTYFDEIISGTKKYEYTEDGEKKYIFVEVSSKIVGYENFWGATETQITTQTITFANGKVGTVKNTVSSSKSRILEYERNPASLSSFYGGYYVKTEVNAVSKYDYDLPKRGKGTLNLQATKTPTIERLIVPKFRDLSNHWAKDSIEKLYSLGIFDEASKDFFSPETPMTRLDFTIAIGKAIDLRVLEEKNNRNNKKQKIFPDLDTNTKDYEYVVSAVEKGVIKGSMNPTNGQRYFDPNGSITREQAAAIFVRALGLESKAPDPGFKTQFKDDANISDYARDGIYVAAELGLMNGDEYGNFRPKDSLNRAQAAAVIVRFLQYLESDLQQNYREDILFFE